MLEKLDSFAIDDGSSSAAFRGAQLSTVALSLLSFITTFVGLWAANSATSRDAAGNPIADITAISGSYDLLLAILLSLGIQVGMFSTAWMFSKQLILTLKKKWAVILGILFIYLCATAISVTFSYIAMFDNMFQADKANWSSDTMREQSEVIVARMEEELVEQRDAARADFATSEADFLANLRVLSGVAGQRRQALLTEIADKERGLAEFRRQNQAQQETNAERAVQLKQQVALMSENRQNLLATRADYSAQVAEYKAQSNELDAQKSLEEGGARGDEGIVGRGPRWKELDKTHDVVKARLRVAENQVDRLNKEVVELDAKAAGTRSTIASLEAQDPDAEVQNADSLAVISRQEEIDRLRVEADSYKIVPMQAGDIPTEKEIEGIESTCLKLKAELEREGQNDVPDFNCSTGDTYERLKTAGRYQQGVEAIRNTCYVQTNPEFGQLMGGAIVNYVRENCIASSGLKAASVQKYQADLRAMSRSRDPDAAPIAYAFAALRDEEPQAIFAMLMALVTDLMILGISLIGNATRRDAYEAYWMSQGQMFGDDADSEITGAAGVSLDLKSDDPSDVEAAKLVLRHLSRVGEDNTRIITIPAEELGGDAAKKIRNALLSLTDVTQNIRADGAEEYTLPRDKLAQFQAIIINHKENFQKRIDQIGFMGIENSADMRET